MVWCWPAIVPIAYPAARLRVQSLQRMRIRHQPTSTGPWVLESAWDHSQTSTAYPWLREPRPRACEHSTRWEDGKTELTISSMGRWQGGTWKSIINCSRLWFMITLDQFLRISHSLSCPLATRVRFGDASVVCSRSRLQSKITSKRW